MYQKSWKDLIRPKRLEVEKETANPFLWKVRGRALRKRIRHYDRKLAAADPSLFPSRRGHHVRQNRRRPS